MQLDLSLVAPSRALEASQRAARKMTPKRQGLYELILAAMTEPLTPDGCAAKIGKHWIEIRPRFSELADPDRWNGEPWLRVQEVNGKPVMGLSALGNDQHVYERVRAA